MMVAIVALSMLGYLVVLQKGCGWPVAAIPFALAAGAIDVLYVAGLFGVLWPAAWVVVLTGLSLLGLGAARGWLNTDRPSEYLSPGFVTFVAFAVFFTWRLQGADFVGWDEFSHWGYMSKEIITTNALISTDSALIYQDYPPGSALFHYLATLGSGFSEAGVYAAHSVLALAGITALCVGARWPLVVATFLFGYFGVFVFARGLQTLDVDHMVAVFFGCGIGAYWVAQDRGRVIRVIPVAFALPLVKSIGILFAIFMTALIACDQLMRTGRSWRRLALVFVLLATPWLANWSWQARGQALHIKPTFDLNVSPSRVAASFSADRSTPRDRVTISGYRTALVSQPVGPPLLGGFADYALSKWNVKAWRLAGFSPRQWAVAFVFFWGVVLMLQRDRRALTRHTLAIMWLATCAMCYAFVLLMVYLFGFGEYEGTRLASFDRYIGTLLLGGAFASFAFFLSQSRAPDQRRTAGVVGLVVMTAGMAYAAPGEAAKLLFEGAETQSEMRARVENIIRTVLPQVNNSKRVYLIWEGSKGFEIVMARYALAPRHTNESCWSVGSSRFPGDVWTCALAIDDFAQRLQEYDFVLLGYADARFWAEYGALFPRSLSALLYKVEKDDGLRLVPQ